MKPTDKLRDLGPIPKAPAGRKPSNIKYPLGDMEVGGKGFEEPYTTKADLSRIRNSIYVYALRNGMRFSTRTTVNDAGKPVVKVWRVK